MSDNCILSCQKLGKTVMEAAKELVILQDADMRVNTAETVAVVGRSGSGKTTLLSLLAGLDVPSSGEVLLCGHALHELDEDARAAVRSQYVGFVFQSFHLIPGFSALENVMLPLEIHRRADARDVAASWLERVSMEHRMDHFPDTLSGGEQQRVALARAFACSPPLIFADEPTGNLDSDTGAQVIDLLFDLNRTQRTTLVLVTHDSVLSGRCDRRFRLEQGRMREAE